jgi:hypothetical protein
MNKCTNDNIKLFGKISLPNPVGVGMLRFPVIAMASAGQRPNRGYEGRQ